jgi:circadian clock protein KaiB
MKPLFSGLPTIGATRLKLYVAGVSSRSQRAIDNLCDLVSSGRAGACEIEVIDVLEFPERAEQERVLATPTLLKDFPPPRRRVTGDLSDLDQVMRILSPVLGRGAGDAGRVE